MKLELSKLNQQAIESTTGSRKVRLSENAASMVFQLFIKNVYSNPIGTVVREITSNCFDSHVEAGVNAPVIIKKSKDPQTNTEYISFIDFGVGMSPERIRDVYEILFESTKRIDNEQIGGFGVGSKSILAYKRANGVGEAEYDNSFNLITNYDGTRYYYLIYEGSESPMVSLLHSEPTTEHNGTEVRIPVLSRDIQRFETEMVKQLYYFENIIFEGFDKEILNNDYKIIQGENFLYRGKDVSSTMHICLGRVAYPIDYNVLGLNSSDYNVPIALRLNVGDINVTVSRESLDYNESTIKILKQKLDLVKNELTQMLVKQYEAITGLKEYFDYKNNFGTLIIGNHNVPLNSFIKSKDVSLSNFKFMNMPVLDSTTLFKIFFEVKVYGKKETKGTSRRSRNQTKDYFNRNYDGLSKKNDNLYFNDGLLEIKRIKQAWLKSEHERYYVILKRTFITEDLNHYNEEDYSAKRNPLISRMIDDQGLPTTTGQLFLDAQQEYFEIVQQYAGDYKIVNVPDDFVINRKRNVLSDDMRNTTIPVNFKDSSGYNNKHRVRLNTLLTYPSIIYYGTTDEDYMVKNAIGLFNTLFDHDCISEYHQYSNSFKGECGKPRVGTGKDAGKSSGKKGILFILISKSNVKYMEYCRNAHHISEFKGKMLYRKADVVLQYFQTHDLVNSFNNDIDPMYKSELFCKGVSTDCGKKVRKIRKFISNIPKVENENKISVYANEIKRVYNIMDVKLNPEQQKMVDLINEIKVLQDINADVVRWIDFPRYPNEEEPVLCDILKKVMVGI